MVIIVIALNKLKLTAWTKKIALFKIHSEPIIITFF